MDIDKYGIEFKFLYIAVPVLMCMMYAICYNLKKFKSIRNFILFKGVAYFYLAGAIIFKDNTERYVTGLTLLIAIFEGFLAIHSSIYAKKEDLIPNK